MTVADVVTSWWGWMSAMLWQSSLLLAAVGLLDRALRGRIWPELLHGLWLLAALKLVLPPQLPSPWRSARLAEAAPAAAEPAVSIPLFVAFAVWAAGVAAWLLAGEARQRSFVRETKARSRSARGRLRRAAARASARLGLRRAVEVRELEATASGEPPPGLGAFTVGHRSPIVFVPSTWSAKLSDDALEHVMAHELAHIGRGDLWLERAMALLHAFYWFHPLVPLARARSRAARELCCDAAVARSFGDPAGYRATLLALAVELLPKKPRRFATSVAFLVSVRLLERRSLLLARLRALEQSRWSGATRHRARMAATTATLLVAAACTLPLAAPAGDVPPGAPVATRAGSTATAKATPEATTELERARTELAGLTGREDVGSLHLRWAVARVTALEQLTSAPPPP